MRLRLRLERNTFPTTLALFPVADPAKTTIAQLLQAINTNFPLESDTWGLEDYSVSINGFECLHYHDVAAVCKEDDEVTIRPLQWLDVRSRRLSGREQITADGRHLVDGVPWGRVALRATERPEVRIPPRKKRRIMVEGEDEEGEVEQLKVTENGEAWNDEDSEDDEMDEDFSSSGGVSEPSVEEDSGDSESEGSGEESSSDSDSDSISASSSDSDDGATDASDSDAPSIASIKRVKSTAPTGKVKKPHTIINGVDEASGINSKRSFSFEDEAVRLSDPNLTFRSPPGEGLPQTRTRNARRRDGQRLKFLKVQGKLPADANLSDMRKWLEGHSDGLNVTPASSHMDGTASGEGGSVDTQTAAGPSGGLSNGVMHSETDFVDVAMKDKAPEVNPELLTGNGAADATNSEIHENKGKRNKKRNVRNMEVDEIKPEDTEQKRQELLSAIHSGGIDVTEALMKSKQAKQAFADSRGSVADQVVAVSNETGVGVEAATAVAEAVQCTPGRRLDVASTQRLLFGSLGLRAPKTQADREKLQQKLAAKAARPKSAGGPNGTLQIGPPQTNGARPSEAATVKVPEIDGDDSWRSKINLSAVECVVEGLALSTPPFPFYQRWDKSLKNKMSGRSGQRSNGPYQASNTRKRKRSGHAEETYDKYNTDGYGDALEYDDIEDDDDGFDDEYWEEGALLDDDREDSEIEDDGFCDLPADVTALASLREEDAKANDFIAFAELAVDESTGWEPRAVTRLAKIVDCENEKGEPKRWILELSQRDRKQKVFDEEGNRVYGKFEMPDEDGEGGEEWRREVEWRGLGDVKLVQRGSAALEVGAAEGVGE